MLGILIEDGIEELFGNNEKLFVNNVNTYIEINIHYVCRKSNKDIHCS